MNIRQQAIGQAIERVEDLRLLRGRGVFSDDVNAERQLHAVILRSPVARGRIRALDPRPALAIPGVHAVITATEIGRPVPRVPIRLFPLPELAAFAAGTLDDEALTRIEGHLTDCAEQVET